MENVIKINETDLHVKMWSGQRMVTLSDIDKVHDRPTGTARRNFNENKNHLNLDEDYIVRNSYEAKTEYNIVAPNGLTLLTESGYLLLVKSFTDDLAWEVQRKLVNSYFKLQELAPQSMEVLALQKHLDVMFVQINNMESMIEKQLEIFEQTKTQLDKVMSNMTLTTVQQNKIHRLAKDRVSFLLGGAHSPEYKSNSRMYFINLWNGLKARFECGSHWQDLNPAAYDGAVKYVQKWSYSE
jgi:hypothetical protein